MKKISVNILAALLVTIILTGCKKNTVSTFTSSPDLTGKLSTIPGKIANVFGWGYNRTSCTVDNGEDTIIFFYAEDQHLYYTFSSNPKTYGLVHETAQNPDFDIVCGKKGRIHISFSDPYQQILYYSQVSLSGKTLTSTKPEMVYNGNSLYTAVAPHLRIFDDKPFLVFMEYGTPDLNQDSKVFVSRKADDAWFTQKIYQHSAKNTQVLGISLEVIQDELFAFIAPNPSGMLISKYVPKNERWTNPISLAGIDPRGHLEWLTLSDSKGIMHIVYRNEKQALGYAQTNGKEWSIVSTESLGLNAFTLFRDEDQSVYLLYNDGKLRKVIGNQVSQSINLKDKLQAVSELTFVRVPEKIQDNVQAVWVKATNDIHELFYGQFNLSEYKNVPELNTVDTSISVKTIPFELSQDDVLQ